jgi:hypothetical protein
MKERLPMILACLFLAWLFMPTKPDPVSIQPTDGLVEQVATVKDFLQVQPIENLDEFDHSVDATKKVEAKKEIVIFTRANCPPCDRWKQIEQPKFERAGWTVAYCDRHDFAITPHFLIEENGKKYESKGYLPFDKIDEVVK